MTNEEAIAVLKEKYCGIGSNDLFVFRKAIEALENAEKYKWHDLRKDTEDLPEKSGRYLIAYRLTPGRIGNAYYTIEYFYRSNEEEITEWQVPSYVTLVAWKEIEQLGGVSDGDL